MGAAGDPEEAAVTEPIAYLRRIEKSALGLWLEAGRGFFVHRGPVRAASLSYTSLLALVPLVALVISISKGILNNQDPQLLTQTLDRFLNYAIPQLQYLSANDAATARQDTFARIQEAITKIDAGALGAFGALTLVSVGISLLSAIEAALNDVWGIDRGRTLARRVVYYWAGVTLGPIFVFLAIGITGSNQVAAVLGHLPGAFVARLFWSTLPFAILSVGLMLLYWTMPNTWVPARAAAWGGATAGTLLQLNNLASAVYFSQVIQYSKVYGSLGAIPVMMVGLYFSWMIVLYGAEVAHAAANPIVQTLPLPAGDSGRSRVVLEVARLVASDFLAGTGGTTQKRIVERLRIPDEWVAAALRWLCDGGFLMCGARDGVDGAPLVYVPARPPSQIAVFDIVSTVRHPRGDVDSLPPVSDAVERVLERLAAAERSELADVTLDRLVSPGETR